VEFILSQSAASMSEDGALNSLTVWFPTSWRIPVSNCEKLIDTSSAEVTRIPSLPCCVDLILSDLTVQKTSAITEANMN
jgi:hypothetical protein